MAKLSSSQPAPPNTPTDAPATQKWVSRHYGSITDNTKQTFAGKIQAPDVITPINVKYFGAKGNGTHDDTKAIQAAVNKFTVSGGGRLYFPAGTYLVTSAITIPFSTNWTIEGDSRQASIIVQSTSNTPIFKFTSNNTWGWTIKNLELKASTAQVSTNVTAAGIYITNSAGVYNFIVENVRFENLANCLYSDTGTSVWGSTWRDIHVQSNVSRSLMQCVAPSGGQPNNKFENVYIRADTMVGPLLDLVGATHTWITGFEINVGSLGPSFIKDTAGGSYAIGTMKIEVGTYTASVTSSSMFNLANGELTAQHIELDTITANLTGVTFPQNCVFRLGGTGANTKIHIQRITGFSNWAITNGTFFLVGGAAAGTTFVVEHLEALPTNVLFTNITSDATTTDTAQIKDWNDGQASTDQGDNNVTVTPGTAQPNILSFETILTAARTVTLPSATAAGNLFNGLTYTVRATAGITVNFALNINNGLVLLDSIPVGKSGAIQYTYRRNAWVQTLKSIF